MTAAAVLFALLLRWFHLERQSLWYDEGYTVLASGLSSANIVRFARSDTYPPLYPLLQHYWSALFGNSESAVRGVSAFAGTVSIAAFYLLARKVLNNSMAVALAMWLFAFSALQVWYSREARAYELASFLCLGGLFASIRFLERRAVGSFIAVVLFVTASLYAHSMMFFYLLALNFVWLTYPSERVWLQRLKELILADLLIGVLYVPWASSLMTQLSYVHGGFWVSRPTLSTLLRTSSLIAGFDVDYLGALAGRLFPLSSHSVQLSIVGGVSLLCTSLVAAAWWRVPQTDRAKHRSLLLYCFVPVVAVFILSQMTKPLFLDRVFISSSAVIPIVFAYPLALNNGERTRILYVLFAIVLAAATALSAVGYLRYQQKEDWRAATRTLLRNPEKNRLIVFAPTAGEILFDYYSGAGGGRSPAVPRIGLPASFLEKNPPRLGAISGPTDISPLRIAVQAERYNEIDLVLSRESPEVLSGLALEYLDQVFTRREEQRFFGIRIIRFVTRSH